MSRNTKQRVTLTDLKEPQQIRELNRQLTWIWDQLLGGLSMKSLNAGARKVIDSKADSEEVDALGNVVIQNSTAIVQTAEKIENTATRVETLDGRMEEAESRILQTPDEIRMAVEKVEVGGRNLLRGTKELDAASGDLSRWEMQSVHDRSEGEDGFYQIGWAVTGLTADSLSRLKSPLFRLPDGWLGRKAALSCWMKSEDWERLDGGLEARICLTTGNRSDDYRWVRMRLIDSGGSAGENLKGDTPADGLWRRIWAVAELTQEGLRGSGTVELPKPVREEKPVYEPAGDETFGIWMQPEDLTVAVGETVELKIGAAGAVEYQWQNSTDGVTWSNSGITGYNTDMLTFSMIAVRYGYVWRCVITGADGRTLASRAARLIAPSPIAKQPESVDAAVGGTAVLKIEVSGAKSYQWQNSQNGVSWSNSGISGYNTDTLSVPVTEARYNYLWRCRVTDAAGIVHDSDPAVIRKPLDAATHGWAGWYVKRNADFLLKAPQLEFGDRPSDWSPAPEDTDAAVAEVSAELTVQAGEISANATKIDTVNQAAANAQSAANAAQGTANGAVQRVTTAETNISALNAQVQTKVNQTDFNALGNRVSSAEGSIAVQAGQIASKVEKTEFDALGNIVSQQGTRIEQTDEQVLILAGKTVGAVNLLKLGDVSFGNSAGTLTGALEERSEAYYCRSRKVMRLFAFSGNYNVGQYDNIQLAKGKEYTVSFWAATGGGDQQLWVNIWNYGRSVDITLGEVIPVRGGGGYYTRTFTCTETDTYALRFINFGGHTTQIMIMDAKLEEGNTATAWSPNPEEFRTGSSVEITEKRVKISSPETLIAIPSEDGERMIAQFDENGVTAERVHAGNVAYRYDGASTIYVNPNATGAQVAAGNYYRSLTDACAALSGKSIDREIFINIEGGSYSEARLTGICGTGSISINGNMNSLTGRLYVGRNTVDITFWGLTIATTGEMAVEQNGPGWVQWSECTFIGNSAAGGYGMRLGRHASAFLYNCGFYNAEHLLGVGTSADVVCNSLKGGGGTNFLYGDGGNVKWYGTRPDGSLRTDHPSLYVPDNLAALTIDYGTAQPSAPAIQTTEYNYLYSDSYRSGWQWFSDDDIRQGYDGGVIYGVIWFDAAAIRSALNGKTINQVSLRLYMAKGVGRGVNVNVELYGSNVSYDRTAAPELTASYGSIGETQPDVVNEITIPAQAVRDMISGAVNALVIKSSDSELHKDRPYSRNYARFAGSTTAGNNTDICPRLTVVYQ